MPDKLSPDIRWLGVVRNAPILTGDRLELKMDSVRRIDLVLPAVSLSPFFATESPRPAKAHPGAWEAIAVALNVNSSATEPFSPVMSAQQWEIEVLPRYAQLIGGEPAPEDESVIGEMLTEALIEGDRKRMLQVFGSEQPFTVDWSFKAINLVSGHEVPVNIGRRVSPWEVAVSLEDGQVPYGILQVTFPEPTDGATYELIASVRMRDTLDTEWDTQHRLYSHLFQIDPTYKVLRQVLGSVADLTGISTDQFITAATMDIHPENTWAKEDPFLRRARIVRTRLLYAAEDQRIPVGELSGMIRMARLAGNR